MLASAPAVPAAHAQDVVYAVGSLFARIYEPDGAQARGLAVDLLRRCLGEPLRFGFVPASGYRPVDAATMPDGRVMILLRRVRWWLPRPPGLHAGPSKNASSRVSFAESMVRCSRADVDSGQSNGAQSRSLRRRWADPAIAPAITASYHRSVKLASLQALVAAVEDFCDTRAPLFEGAHR